MIVLFSSHLVYLLLSNGYVIFQSTGFVTKDQLVTELGWDLHRADIALEHLVREGLAWVVVSSTSDIELYSPTVN